MLEMPDGKYFRYPFATCKSTAVAIPLPGISGSWAWRSFIPRGFQVERPGTLPHKGRGKLLPFGFSEVVFFRWSWSNRGKDDRPNFWSYVDWGVDVAKITGECREWRVAIGRNIKGLKGLNIELNLRNRLGVWYITCKVGGEIIPKKIQAKGSLLRGHQIPLHANTWELHHLPSSKIYCYQISNFVMFFFSICRYSICSIAIFFYRMNLHDGSVMGKKKHLMRSFLGCRSCIIQGLPSPIENASSVHSWLRLFAFFPVPWLDQISDR